MNDKISVIVPVYNVEKYLKNCLDSIINQSFVNLEILLINDGSTDSSDIICDNYSLIDNRITVINKLNGGLADARNAGLDLATGGFVSFIDSDDFIHKDFYRDLFELITKYDADMAQCNFANVNEESMNCFKTECIQSCTEAVLMTNFQALNNLYDGDRVNAVIVCNKLYKIGMFSDIRFPRGRVHEDDFTMYKILYNAKKIVFTLKPMYFYMRRNTSITGAGFNERSFDGLDAVKQQIYFYQSVGLPELEKKAACLFECYIRKFMVDDLKSDLNNKNELFHRLLRYYRKNYVLFGCNSHTGFKKRIIMILFKCSPKFLVKLLCDVIYFKRNM